MSSKEHRSLLFLTLGALLIRLAAALGTVEMSGDGPVRAVLAYVWSMHPHWIAGDIWLPLPCYLTGFLNMLWPDPAWVTRLLNVGLGTCCVPLYVLLVRRVFDARTGWGAGLLLACMPLHIELSASSMTEMLYLRRVLGALWLLCEEPLSGPGLAVATVLLVVAEMTRYEGWPLSALCVAWVAAKTRRWSWTWPMAAVLAAFPLYWFMACYHMFGSLWYVAQQEVRGTEYPQVHLSYPRAVLHLLRQSAIHVGWGGVALMVAGAVRGHRPAGLDRRVLYGFASLTTLGNLQMTFAHGGMVWDRFLLLMLLLWLPFGLSLIPRRNFVVAMWGVGGLLALSFVCGQPNQVYIGRVDLTAVRQVDTWLGSSQYRNSALLATRCDWMGTYFPLYYLPCADHYMVVSDWIPDPVLRDFITDRRPPIVITIQRDEDLLRRIETVSSCHIDRDSPLLTAPPFVVYRIDP